jgi:flagellar biosynthetic protein FliQ
MTQDDVVNVCTSAMELAMKVGLPILLVGLVIGLVVSIFQAVTQIQEQTLSFIPKIIGLAVVLMVGGPWMLGELIGWTQELYGQIPSLVGS